MHRRAMLRVSAALLAGAGPSSDLLERHPEVTSETRPFPRAYSLIPVVGDGKWIWKAPPESGNGYLEPRKYEASMGIEFEGQQRPARQILATTPVPAQLPEQTIESSEVASQGCRAAIRQLTSNARQLIVAVPALSRGQIVRATANFTMTLHKQYRGFERDHFPADQEVPRQIRQQFLADSPGIQVRDKAVRDLAMEIAGQFEHAWDKAKAFHEWVWENIRGREQSYTTVLTAIRDRVGDCEERAAVFVAFCRASGIPARLVWVPNHNWAEFYLHDHEQQGQWIPSHTAAYSWFAWTGVHEMVLQKGDRVFVPEQKKPQRLLADWMQWSGARPKVRYWGTLKPLADSPEADPGPGARLKNARGEWPIVGDHEFDRRGRDGQRVPG